MIDCTCVWWMGSSSTYYCEGPNAKNNAKLLAQKIRRERREVVITVKAPSGKGDYLVEVKECRASVVPETHRSEDYYRRTPGPRREKKRPRFRKPTDDRDEYDLLEERLAKSPAPHRSGWKDAYRPTRDRYWRPPNNNWKGRRKTKYRIK